VLFSGQAGVPDEATASPKILVILVGKALGYGVSLGCGFRGSPVFPAIFLGIAVASSRMPGSTCRRPSPSRSDPRQAWRREPGC
jgi:hypothetical protein